MAGWSDERRHAAMSAAYARAVQSCPERVHEVWYEFAGHAVQTRIVGDRLAERLALPFAHLRRRGASSSGARLTVDLWDELETGTDVDAEFAPDPLGRSTGFSMSCDGRFATSVLQHSVTSLDRREERIVGAVVDAHRLSLYEQGRPLHVPLTLWYNDRNVPLVHAALISHGGDGILLVGPSGAGKTTSSLSCAAAGFEYLADDLAGLEISADGVPWGHSVYSSAFVDEDTACRLPGLSEHALAGAYDYEGKRLVFMSRIHSMCLMGKTRIRAVALVRIADTVHTQARPATKAESLLTVARSAMQSGVLSPGRRGFELLGTLADGVPTFWLELGRDPGDIARCARTLLPGGREHAEERTK
jgi:hypothetical protein